jgi:hypothetical protein
MLVAAQLGRLVQVHHHTVAEHLVGLVQHLVAEVVAVVLEVPVVAEAVLE